jgi:NADP-dependent 3-hydroxy acid dehydrogenase YdfG
VGTSEGNIFAGRAIAVAGASRGIGRAVAALLAQRGATVLAGARAHTEPPIDGVRTIVLDVTDEAGTKAFAAAAQEAGADALVHNAGVGSFDPLEHASPAEFRRIVDTNVLGLFLACRAFIPHFRARHAAGLGSQVVVVTSDVSMRTFAGGGLYTASKHAQRALVRTLAAEGQGYGLRVTEVRPGMVDTYFNGRTPGSSERARHLRSEDVADAVIQALSAPAHVRIDEIVMHPVVQDVVF